MSLSIKPDRGLWIVYRENEEVFSGRFSQVEDWLDSAENRSVLTARKRSVAPAYFSAATKEEELAATPRGATPPDSTAAAYGQIGNQSRARSARIRPQRAAPALH